MWIDSLYDDFPRECLDFFHATSLEDLFVNIGLGRLSASLVAQKILQIEPGKIVDDLRVGFDIKGTEGPVVRYCSACYPIPGDMILGVMRANQGVMVHREHCELLRATVSRNKLLHLDWNVEAGATFTSKILLSVKDNVGILAIMSAIIADYQANIVSVIVPPESCAIKNIVFVILVKNRIHLAKIIKKLKNLDFVQKIKRV
jgi:(p)ppGpp synthase/HD superfamily hydrolase